MPILCNILLSILPSPISGKTDFFITKTKTFGIQEKKINNLIRDSVWDFDVRIVDRDRYFLTLIGKFSYKNKKIRVKEALEVIAQRLEKEDMLLRPFKKGWVKILVKRSIPNKFAILNQ